MAVELYINDSLVDLKGNEEIAIDYAIFNIEDIKQKKSARSYTFSLPKTAKNRAIFENPDDLNSLSNVPYSKQKARLYVDGIDVNITTSYIQSSDNEYRINLYGGNNGDFFAWLKENRFADVNLCSLNHFWTKTNISNSRTNTSGYIYPIINYHSDAPNSYIDNTQRHINVGFMYPAIFYDSLLSQLVSEYGYTIDNKIENDAIYSQNKLLLCYGGDDISHNGDVSFYTGKFSTAAVQAAQYDINNDLFFDFDTIEQPCEYWVNVLTLVSTVFNFQASVRVTGNLTWEITNNEAFTVTGNLIVFDTVGNNQVDTPITLNVGANTITASFVVDVALQDLVTFDNTLTFAINNISATAPNIDIEAGTFIEFTNVEVLQSQPLTYKDAGVFVYMTPNSFFGNFTLAQIFSNYLNMFAGLISVNDMTKEVVIFPFKYIKQNISNAYDWSDKIDLTESPSISFAASEYGKRNNFRYKENKDEAKPLGTDGVLLIQSENIEDEKEYVQLDYSATNTLTLLKDIEVPTIPVVENGEAKFKVNPRVLLLEPTDSADLPDTANLEYVDGGAPITISTDLPLCRFIDLSKSYNLGFGNTLINDFYSDIKDVIERYKVLKCNVRLNASDINQLDFTRPVWIEYFNSYFYISQISGYTPTNNESTSVELVKLF